MVEIQKENILVSEEYDDSLRGMLNDLLVQSQVSSREEVREVYEVAQNWDLIISYLTTEYEVSVAIPHTDWKTTQQLQ